jgi:hypothetical protein
VCAHYLSGKRAQSADSLGGARVLREYTELSIALEPEYEGGGALRLLSRLHAVVPRLPLFSSWVDPEEAVARIEQAYAMAPDNPGNQFLYALTLKEIAPERLAETIELLERVATQTPRADMEIEDLSMTRQAKEALVEIREES